MPQVLVRCGIPRACAYQLFSWPGNGRMVRRAEEESQFLENSWKVPDLSTCIRSITCRQVVYISAGPDRTVCRLSLIYRHRIADLIQH